MTDESVFTPPTVVPYTARPVCFACGADSGFGLYTWFMAYVVFGAQGFSRANVAFCAGNKAPSETRQVLMNPLAALTGATTQAEVTYECYGIDYPHLHLTCRECGARWLMRMKGLRP